MDALVALGMLILLCSTCVLVGEVQDPFAKPPRMRSNQVIVLEGIVEVEGKKCVSLARGSIHELVHIGGSFDGFTVAKITQKAVELVNANETLVLQID
jgi:hypothetical protein